MTDNSIGIAGLGIVSGYGWGRETYWKGICSGKPAARLVGGFGPDGTESAWVARVPDGGDPSDGEQLFARAFLASGHEAIADACARGWVPGPRVGLLHAGYLNDMYAIREFSAGRATRSRDFVQILASTPAAMLMKAHGFHGPSFEVAATCSSTNNALLVAKLWLDAGVADDVVVVSADLSFTPEILGGFAKIGAAITDAEPLDACRPFQEGSRGFSAGEAAVTMVLTSQSTHEYARLLGGAMTNDGYHALGMDPTNTQVVRCVNEALSDAHVDPADVTYLNAHGTGTTQCDAAERGLLETIFPACMPHVYALKPLVGHCLAAAGAIELAATLMAYQQNVVATPRIVSKAHPRLLDGLTPFEGGVTLKTSMGMGGYNSGVLIGPPVGSG
jgi:3-oxoacyl-[acyl-carrier-protein] synthase II